MLRFAPLLLVVLLLALDLVFAFAYPAERVTQAGMAIIIVAIGWMLGAFRRGGGFHQ